MIGYTYTITNKDGDSFKINDHVTDPLNFIALQQYPDMDIDVKNSELPLEGQHGIWDFFSFFGKRRVSFAGVVVGENEAEVETLKNQIVRTLAFPVQPEEDTADGYVTISWTDANSNVWSIEGKIDRAPKFSRNMRENYKLDFLISFKSASPFILASTANEEEGTRGYFSFGVMFPIEFPVLMSHSSFDDLDIDNTGTLYAHTIIRLYGEAGGDITNPTVTNFTTGKAFKVNTVLSGVDEYIEIDSKEGSVVDHTGADLSAYIDEDSQFVLLKPGMNTIVYTADEDIRTPAGALGVVFKPTNI